MFIGVFAGAIGLFFAWTAIQGVVTGKIKAKPNATAERAENPMLFWFGVLIHLLAATGGLRIAWVCFLD